MHIHQVQMEEKLQFKLIGVRPLKGCASHIRKVLKEDTTYFLYNEYEVDPENSDRICLKSNNTALPISFFSKQGKGYPVISISAIVGKNGDGKSSIVELIMRILNNFAYYSGFKKKQSTLIPVAGLKAILYYSIGENTYSIETSDNGIRFTDSD